MTVLEMREILREIDIVRCRSAVGGSFIYYITCDRGEGKYEKNRAWRGPRAGKMEREPVQNTLKVGKNSARCFREIDIVCCRSTVQEKELAREIKTSSDQKNVSETSSEPAR